MLENLVLSIALLVALASVSLVAPRMRVPAPILLAISGAALSFVPGLRRAPVDPHVILAVFLPPLLYADAFDTSWTEFRRWLRPILLLAVGLVGVTIVTVGVAMHALFPALPWAACFTLGAIVSPTDTVAVQSIIERLRIPRRTTSILSGESLVNDATALVGVQLGVTVASTQVFEVWNVAGMFLSVAGLGILVGVAVGVLFSWVNRFVHDTKVLFVVSVVSPYLAFLVADGLHASGVLAVVIAGFIVSWRIHTIPSEARVELYSVWDMLTYVLNGLCFLFVGLEAPRLLRETDTLGDTSLLVAGLAISAVVIVTRFAWTFPNIYLPYLLSPSLRKSGLPPWRNVTLVSWCGMRGAISLAAALALPMTTLSGDPLPGRTPVLVCTLVVILVTLVVQGLTLTPLIRMLGLRADEDGEREVRAARESLLQSGIRRLDEFCTEISCPISVHHFRALMADELATLKDEDEDGRKSATVRLAVSNDVRKAVTTAQEAELLRLRDQGTINDRTYIELQLELDRSHMDLVKHDARS